MTTDIQPAEGLINEYVIGHAVVDIENEDTLVLDNGVRLTLFESDFDCCARAWGEWKSIVGGDKNIITDVEYDYSTTERWGSTTESVTITLLNNGIPQVQGSGFADDGNGGYYFSVLSVKVHVPGEGDFEEAVLVA